MSDIEKKDIAVEPSNKEQQDKPSLTSKKEKSRVWQKKAKEQFISVVFLSVVVLVMVNSLLLHFRIDTTKNKVYSISDVTVDILSELDDTVYIDYYLSPKLKLQQQEVQQILDTLQEIAVRSKGTVVVTEIETESMSEEESQEKGLEPRQLQFIEKNEASFAVVYSGIIISYQERKSIIPFIIEPAIIEYQVVSKILETYRDDKRVVGLLFLDAYYDDPQNTQVLQQVLGQDFEVKIVEKEPFPDDLDVLFVSGNQDVSDELAYHIDQFIMKGKGVFFAVDRANVDLQRGLQTSLNDTVLNKMIDQYGLTIKDQIVLDDLNKQIPLSGGPGISIFQSYPMWPTISQQNVASDHPITNRFAGLDFYWTSPILVKNEKADYVSNIVKSSEKGWTVGLNPQGNGFNVSPNANFYTLKTEANIQQYNLASVYNGPLASAVEAGLIEEPEEGAEQYIANTDQARFLVVGSHYSLSPMFQVTNAQYNFSFVSNSSEWLAADLDLLKIKSRTVRNIQLNKITDETKKETYMSLVQLLNNLFIPLLIVIVAIVVLFMRRNLSRRRY